MALKKGETENKTHRRCKQTQCGYYLHGDCKPCDDCKSKPYEINKTCKRCYACENVPGSLRWGDPSNNMLDDDKDLLNDMVDKTVKFDEKRTQHIVVGVIDDE